MNLKSVHIDMGCKTFCSSNVQVIIFTGFDAWSFLYFCPSYFTGVEIPMENKKALDVFKTYTTGWSFSSSLFQPTSSLFSSLLFLLRMKMLTVCPVLSKLTPKAPYCTASLLRNALKHPAFVVGFLLLVWFCLTQICELTNAFSCCINEGWMLPGYGEQKTGMFSDELGSLALAHSVTRFALWSLLLSTDVSRCSLGQW